MSGSKNGGTPKWMVYTGKPYEMDDLGVPLFLETPLSNLSARRAAFFGGALACGGRKVGKCPPGKKTTEQRPPYPYATCIGLG